MTDAIRYEKGQDNIVVLTMDMPGQSANTMNAEYRTAMGSIVDRLESEKDSIAGVILTSAKKTFFAGGDLNELIKVTKADAAQFYAMILHIKGQLRRLECLGKPVVAAINGAALGGGWEIALACHYRIAVDSSSVQLGLPEVTLGLLPGGGGVVRMVRILGLEKCLPYLLEGKKIRPQEALKAGLINELAGTIYSVRRALGLPLIQSRNSLGTLKATKFLVEHRLLLRLRRCWRLPRQYCATKPRAASLRQRKSSVQQSRVLRSILIRRN